MVVFAEDDDNGLLHRLRLHRAVLEPVPFGSARHRLLNIVTVIDIRFGFYDMLDQDDQILDIDNAVAPGHRPDVTQGIICTPAVDHDVDVRSLDGTIAVEVHNRNDRRLPEVLATMSARPIQGPVGKVKGSAI